MNNNEEKGMKNEKANSGKYCCSRKTLIYSIIVGILLIVIAVTLIELSRNEEEGILNVVKSPEDKRDYRALKLANGLRVILISDPNGDKAAASLVVGAGFLSDPPEVRGMAHYLEHFLFMGTEKYPEDNQLSQFLAKNGGRSNAFTSTGLTGYYFDSSVVAFDEALDRFSQFVISPLLEESKLEGVVSAVNSEFEHSHLDDYRRSAAVIRSLTNASHPYSRIHSGNTMTLLTHPKEMSIDVRAAMLKFFKDFYSANLMTLTVLSKDSLDHLEEMATKYFQNIPNRQIQSPYWPDSPWGKDQLERRIDIVRLVELHRMDLTFPIPDYTDLYKSRATEYVVWLLGHEGPGSILSLLKSTKKWATGLHAFTETPGRGFSNVRIYIYLTSEGFQHIDDIVFYVFQYIEMLKKMGPQKWYWETLKTISETRFRFKEDQNAIELVKSISRNMQFYPMNEVWTANYFFTEYKPQLITKLLTFLIPSNLLLVTSSKDNAGLATHKEPSYGAEYSYKKIDSDTIKRWTNCGLNEDFKFPVTSEFLPTNFDLKPIKNSHKNSSKIKPRVILNDKMSRIWFLQDEEFLVPRASINLNIFNPYTSKSSRNRNLQNLLVLFVHDLVKESSYSALEAGLGYEIASKANGIFIRVRGYDQTISTFLKKLVKFILNSPNTLKDNQDRFDIVKENYLQNFENYKFEKPGTKAKDNLIVLMTSQVYSKDELLDSAQNLTIQDVIDYTNQIFSNVRLHWLIHGNIMDEEAFELNRKCLEYFQRFQVQPMLLSELSHLSRQGVRLPIGSTFLYAEKEEKSSESCVRLYFQPEGKDLRQDRILMMFMDKMLNVPCFNVLRTEEKLGYSVSCFSFEEYGFSGFQVFIQGENHPNYTESRIHHFLEFIRPTVNNLTLEEFTKYKAAVGTTIKARKPKTLNDRAKFINKEIEMGSYDFERENEDLIKLQDITMEQVINFFNTWISPRANGRKMLSIHMISQNATRINEIENSHLKYQEKVMNITEFKTRLGFSPITPVRNVDIPPWKAF